MTFNYFKRAVSSVTAAVCLTAAIPAIPLTAAAEQHKIIVSDSYDYEYWSDQSQNTISFDIDGQGGFEASWNTASSCFFAKGLIEQKPVSNNYKIDYDLSIDFGPVQESAERGTCTYLCAYGFLKEPAAEFFFADYDSYPERFEDSETYTSLGSFETGGQTYDLYCNKFSRHDISGSYSFDRYYSVRRGGKMKGRDSYQDITNDLVDYKGEIDVGAHFDALEKLGKKIGDLDRLSFNVEAFCSNGSVRLKSCELTEQPEENEDTPKSSGSFERNGGTYSYSSSCRPSKIDMKVYKEKSELEISFRWPNGKNVITKTFLQEPVKIGKNDLILIRENYDYSLNFSEEQDNCFTGIFEFDLSDAQKVFLVDTGLNISEGYIADLYAKQGINAEFAGKADGKNTVKLRETFFAEDQREMYVYPFTYTVKNGGAEEKHTDYWLADYQNDTFSYRSSNQRYSGQKIVSGSSYSCYNIHNAADIFRALKEYGLSADTINSANFVFTSDELGGSLTVNELALDISHFPDAPYFYSYGYSGEGEFSVKPNENGLIDFDWYNQRGGHCWAEAGKRFEGGLDLENVESIVADYSGTIDSVEIFGTKKDLTSVYLYGKFPVSGGKIDEFYIDVAYLGNNDEFKKKNELSSPLPTVEDNGKTYDIYRRAMCDEDGYEYVSFIDDEDVIDRQYRSLEQEPPVNGEDAAVFSGSIDITKHIAAYKAAANDDKCNALSELAICADATNSVGTVSIEKFDITVTYKDGRVEKYTPYGADQKEIVGDLNGDNRIDSLDVALCRRELLSAESSTNVNKLADMDGNGRIELNDLVLITAFVLGKKG